MHLSRPRPRGTRRTLAVLVLPLLFLAGCAPPAPDVGPGTLAAGGVDLTGQTYRVGGKDFPEQLVLCRLTMVALDSLGAETEDRCGIPDGAATRAALVPTERIDLYWEYTGTAAATFLAAGGRQWPSDPVALHAAVRDADAANGVAWRAATPFDDTYALATTRANAERLGVDTVSDWARLVQDGHPEATVCVEPEFAARPDGLAALLRAYDVTRPYDSPPEVTTVDHDVVYRAVTQGAPCTFGEVFSTDGRVPADDLVLLVDDREHFATYNAAATVRQDVLDRAPSLGAVLDALAVRLTDEVISALNAEVEPGGRAPEEVATEWLLAEGLVSGPAVAQGAVAQGAVAGGPGTP